MKLEQLPIEDNLNILKRTKTFRVIEFSEKVDEEFAVYLNRNNQGLIKENGVIKPYKHVVDGRVKGRPDEYNEEFKENLRNCLADGEFYEDAW